MCVFKSDYRSCIWIPTSSSRRWGRRKGGQKHLHTEVAFALGVNVASINLNSNINAKARVCVPRKHSFPPLSQVWGAPLAFCVLLTFEMGECGILENSYFQGGYSLNVSFWDFLAAYQILIHWLSGECQDCPNARSLSLRIVCEDFSGFPWDGF